MSRDALAARIFLGIVNGAGAMSLEQMSNAEAKVVLDGWYALSFRLADWFLDQTPPAPP